MDHFCYAKFSAYYTIGNKPDHLSEYQPIEFQDKFVEENHDKWLPKTNQVDEISNENKILY